MTTPLEDVEDGAAPSPRLSGLGANLGPAADTRPRSRVPWTVVAVAVGAAAGATAWSAATHSMLLYGDSLAHLDVARRVTDGLRTGLAQLGSVWLPLPHLLMVPLTAFWPLWHSGAAGAIVGGVCFVYSAIRIFSLVEEVTASRLGAWCAFGVFVANLNLLYVQSTALTEPVLLATMIGAGYHLTRWMRTLAYPDLLWAAAFVFAATLTRYEAWAFFVAGIPLVFIWSRQATRRPGLAGANALVFSAIGGYGIVLWLLYNLVIFGSPLYFLQSAYSASSINGTQAHLAGTSGSIVESSLTYGWAVIGVCGPAVVVMVVAAAAALAAARHPERQRTIAILLLLLAPVAFEVLSLFLGETTIRVPQLGHHGMWNDRYGLVALPLCAVIAGIAAGRWRGAAIVVAGTAVAATATMGLGTPLLLADGRVGTSSATGGHPELAAAYLHSHYRGGRVLADDSASSTLIFLSGLDLDQFVTDGDHPYFQNALQAPGRSVEWIVATSGDAVSADIAAHPARFSSFVKIMTDGAITLYQRR